MIKDKLSKLLQRVLPKEPVEDSPFITENDIKKNISGSVKEMDKVREYVNLLSCPCCGKVKQLFVTGYRRGNTEWEANVQCQYCLSKGILNQTGLSFNLVYRGIASLTGDQVVSKEVR